MRGYIGHRAHCRLTGVVGAGIGLGMVDRNAGLQTPVGAGLLPFATRRGRERANRQGWRGCPKREPAPFREYTNHVWGRSIFAA